MESKKWSERKEALEIVEKATNVPYIQNTDFSELVRILRKTIAKDANINVATLAAKCLCQLAQGLKANFAPYADSCMTILFDKFKEKKPNVVSVLRDATDAIFVGTNIENIYEEVIQFLDNKNPQIKSEVALFLARTFSHYPQQVRNKKTLRPLTNALVKTLSDMDSTVRENSAMAIGTAMKVIGENILMPLIGDIEPIKIAKIKECCEKAEIITAPVNGQSETYALGDQNGQVTEHVQAQENEAQDDTDDDERIYEMLEAVDIAGQIPQSFYTQMESKKWSDRKEALETIEKITAVPKISNSDFSDLIRVLKKTVAKDSNIVVVASASKCLCQLAQGLRTNFAPYSNSCLTTLFEKFKEKKPNVIAILRDAADAAFVGTNLESIYEDVIQLLDNKNPQIKSEMSLFLTRTFSKYPAQVLNKKTLRPLINALIKTLSDMDATVRDNSAMAIGTAMKVTGEKVMMTLIADVEPIKLPKIKEFCEKAQVRKIPQSAITAMQNPTASQPPPHMNNNSAAQHGPKSSATMVRSTSNRRITTGGIGAKSAAPRVASGPTPTGGQGGSNATVKRNATIIKRSVVPGRRSIAPPSSAHAAVPATNVQQLASMGPPPLPVATNATLTNHTNNINHLQQQRQALNSLSNNTTPSPPSAGSIQTPAKPVFASTPATNNLYKHGFLDMVILKLISDNQEEVMEALEELEEVLNEDTEQDFRARINQLVDLTCLQLISTFDVIRSSSLNGLVDPQASRRLLKIAELLKKLFARRQLIAAASHQKIRFLLVQLFTLTQTCGNLADDGTVRKTLNNITVAVMDGFEPATIMCLLTGLLNELTPMSIVEPVKDAIIRSMRSFK